MAEASCSGTTPFKRLVDHQSAGINHQDRLVADRPANSSFRSTPAHQSDLAQNAFGAFVGGPSQLPGLPHDPATRLAAHVSTLQPQPTYHHPQHGSFSPLYTHAAPESRGRSSSSGNNLGSSWAADFSRFSAAQPPFAFAPQHNTGLYGNTHTAFNTGTYSSLSSSGAGAFGVGAGTGYANTHLHAPAAQRQGDFDQEMARWMSAHGGGDMADVDAAMDQMARDLEASEQQSAAEFAKLSLEVSDAREGQGQEQEQGRTLEQEQELERAKAAEQVLAAQENLLSEQQEALLDERADERTLEDEGKEEQDGGGPRSGVAEAAERLLDCVKHEGGEKWQNSVFLSLMRDFRDGRKDIVGDEIRASGAAGVDAQAGARAEA